MSSRNNSKIGIMFRREHLPEALPDFARKVEEVGFDELWVVEDCFYAGGISAAATALACTDSITIGLGIMPAVVRNPVFAAMEIATLARLYPGRFLPGLGHGVSEWMHQISAFPKSQLRALEEVTVTIRALLAGEQVTFKGQQVQLDDAKLVHPPDQAPPVSLGVIGPKSLALSGRVADGTILSEYSSPAYVAWAKEQIACGIENDHARKHCLTIFAFACAATTKAEACRKLRPMVAEAIASGGMNAKLAPMGILPQVRAYMENGGQQYLENQMPDDWIEQLTVAGTPQDWRLAINKFIALEAHSIVLVPMPDAGVDEVEKFAQHLQ